jgi:glycosyltransferase involved in cell wall biosynthesis
VTCLDHRRTQSPQLANFPTFVCDLTLREFGRIQIAKKRQFSFIPPPWRFDSHSFYGYKLIHSYHIENSVLIISYTYIYKFLQRALSDRAIASVKTRSNHAGSSTLLNLVEQSHHAYQNLANGNRQMKEIVHITEAFGGGVLSMLVELSNRAAEAGADVSVIYSLRRETPHDFARLFHPKIKMTYVAMCREISFKKDWSSLLALVQSLRDRNPEVIHLHSSKAGALGRAAAKIASPHAKVLYSPHGPAFLRRDVSPTKQFAYLSFERLANYIGGTIVACSRSELHEIKDRVHARAPILIENGVDVSEIPVQRTRRDGKVVIGMTGRASFQKNHEVFIQLANELRDPGVSFVWIGGHTEDVSERDRDNAVTCSGWVTRARALELMSQLDVYVQTSRWEGMPLALIEAQVAGIPAVVTNVVGNRDVVIHGVTGFVASNAEEIAVYLALLRDNWTLRQQMGAAARKRAMERFSMDAIFREWRQLYGLADERNTSKEPLIADIALPYEVNR